VPENGRRSVKELVGTSSRTPEESIEAQQAQTLINLLDRQVIYRERRRAKRREQGEKRHDQRDMSITQ
jgi:hypothetical protein